MPGVDHEPGTRTALLRLALGVCGGVAMGVGCGFILLSGCAQVLGDYEVLDTDSTTGSTTGSTSSGVVPCWYREIDGLCACEEDKPTDQYVPASTCRPEGYPNAGVCCGYDGWPDQGSCLCAVVRCQAAPETPNYCGCWMAPLVEGFIEMTSCRAEPEEPWSSCCEGPGTCNCFGDPCDVDAGETEVLECDVDDVAATISCGEGGYEVSSCR